MRKCICGIYMIQNKINGKIYIGQSIDIYKRWKSHINSKNKSIIHKAFNKYGIDNFSFSIIERCLKENLNQREKFYIKLYHSIDHDFGYNILQGGNDCEWTDELKKKHSEILSKVHNTKEFKENASKKSKELWQNKEFRKKMINSRKNMYNDDFKDKISSSIKILWENKDYRNKVTEKRNEKLWNEEYRNEREKLVTDKSVLIRCIDDDKILHMNEWIKLGFISIKMCCEGIIDSCNGLHFEYNDNPLTEEQKKLNRKKYNENENNKSKRLCLDPFTNKPLTYSSLSRKKRKNLLYKNVILKDCLIKDEDLEYYENLRNELRHKPYTFNNEKERYNSFIEKHKNDKKWIEEHKQKDKLKREKLCKDPITNEIIRYDKLIYRKRTKLEYKNIILKDCVIKNEPEDDE